MNVERHYKTLGLLWLTLGSGNSVALAAQLSQVLIRLESGVIDSVVESLLIGLAVSFLTFLGGWGLFRRKLWGRITVFVISFIYVAYGVLYILFAAPEEEGTITTIVVLCMMVLGLYSFFFLFITSGSKHNTAI